MFSLRPAREPDAAAIRAIYAPIVRDTHISFEEEVPSAAEIARRVRETLPVYPWLVCERESAVIGYAYGARFRGRPAYGWGIETSVYVAEAARGAGAGRALYSALIEIARLQGFVMAYAAIALPNPASVRLHEKLGFEPAGVLRAAGFKLGAWRDVGWWQLPLREPPPAPERPLPFAAVRDMPECAAALARRARAAGGARTPRAPRGAS